MSGSKKTGYVSVFVIVLLLFATQIRAESQDSSLQTDTPAYGVRGPHPVGTRDFVIEGDAPLDITLWYPAQNPDNLEESVTYKYTVKLGIADVSPTVSGNAIADAPYHLEDESYPLVVISPGFLLGRTTYAWLAEHLASHGFVVIAPEHVEQMDDTLSDFWRATVLRPEDIRVVLDYAQTESGKGGAFDGLIDLDKVAVLGHSLGGYTSLAVAGAQMDMMNLSSLCDAIQTEDDPRAWLCGLILAYSADMAELAELDTVPEGLWESWGDDRVDAIVPMAGDAYMFGETGLANVTIPVMALGGTADTGTPYDWGTQMTFDHVSSNNKIIVGLENAEHMIFGSSCEVLPFFEQIGFQELCSDAVWDMNRAHDLVNHFTTAFLLAELKQDGDAARALAADKVNFPGVSYATQGY